MKRIISLLLVTVMCFGTATVALAAETPETKQQGNNNAIVVEESLVSDTTANSEIVPFAAETWGKPQVSKELAHSRWRETILLQ